MDLQLTGKKAIVTGASVARVAVKMSESHFAVDRSPLLGEHNTEIYAEWLGDPRRWKRAPT